MRRRPGTADSVTKSHNNALQPTAPPPLSRGVARRHKEVRIVQLRQFERSRFFTGQVLTADDLQREQDYHRDKARLHIASCMAGESRGPEGLDRPRSGSCLIWPWLDCAGNELILPTGTKQRGQTP